MRTTLATLAFAAAAVAAPSGSAVTAAIAPSTTAAGCASSFDGPFQIQLLNATHSKRETGPGEGPAHELLITLQNGILKDGKGRTGYIASNNQFQFDGPPQAGAIYTAGWSICPNKSLAIGDDTLFKACLSGTFYNLYDENSAQQCSPVYIQVYPTVAQAGASQIGDGQVQASGAASQIGDGQVQASGAAQQIGDGQVQAPTGAVQQIGDGQVQAPTAAISQIGDGQIQAPTAAVSQIGDGQVQAPTAAVSQIGDGQVQAPTAAVSQIGDGQVQAPTAAVSQIGDGQIQAPTAGNSTVAKPTASATAYTGGASTVNGAAFSLVAAVVMAVAML